MNLAQPPTNYFVGWGDLQTNLQEWIQPPGTWRVFLYDHEGVARINGRSILYSREKGVVFPPYAACGHVKIGPGTSMTNAYFSLSESTDLTLPHAVPLEFEVLPGWYHLHLQGCELATEGAMRARAMTWHILWTIAKPLSVLREQPVLYEAEDLIRSSLDKLLRVAEIARQLDVSQSALLKWFQAEHGTSVLGFIRQTRAREACRILATSNLKVKEVAARVGVPDLHRFNKLVRLHCGLSPREYRVRSS